MTKRAATLARVSGEEQNREGFSLDTQRHKTAKWCAENGYTVVHHAEDGAWSGDGLVRPGLNEIKRLAKDAEIDVMVVAYWDRVSRGSTQEFVDRFLTPHGVAFVALDFRFENNAAGRMQGRNADNFAAYFREVSGEKSLEVRKERARAGNIIATVRPDFGFEYAIEGEGRSRRVGYRVDPENMGVVRRILRDVANGTSINATRNGLRDDGIKPPNSKNWEREFVRSVVTDDVYSPHTREELEGLVSEGLLSPGVLAGLDPEREYGIWWYGRRSIKTEHVEEPDPGNPGGVRVKKKRKVSWQPREKWIAVPVDLTGSGLERETVDAARRAIEGNVSPRESSRAAGRVWTLDGLFYCRCGRKMICVQTRAGRSRKLYSYYKCGRRAEHGKDACDYKGIRAETAEEIVDEYITSLPDSGKLIQHEIMAIVESERAEAGDAPERAKHHRRELESLEKHKSRFQYAYAEGALSLKDMQDRTAEIDSQIRVVEKSLEDAESAAKRFEGWEKRWRFLENRAQEAAESEFEHYTPPEERNEQYRSLGMRITPGEEKDTLHVWGVDFSKLQFARSHCPRSSTGGWSP